MGKFSPKNPIHCSVCNKVFIPSDKCEKCGSTKNLLVHHIDHNRSHNYKANLMVLCKRCHQEHHCVRDAKGRFARH